MKVLKNFSIGESVHAYDVCSRVGVQTPRSYFNEAGFFLLGAGRNAERAWSGYRHAVKPSSGSCTFNFKRSRGLVLDMISGIANTVRMAINSVVDL